MTMFLASYYSIVDQTPAGGQIPPAVLILIAPIILIRFALLRKKQ